MDLTRLNSTNIARGALTSNVTDTSATPVIAAKSTMAIHITDIYLSNAHASTGTWVKVLNGSTTMYTVYCGAGGGGADLHFTTPLPGAVGSAWSIQCETTGTEVRAGMVGRYEAN